MPIVKDKGTCKTVWKIHRFEDADKLVERLSKFGADLTLIAQAFPERFVGTIEIDGNIMLNSGIQAFAELLAGISSPTLWNNANAALGVGDSATGEAATQTDLQASSNKTYVAQDATYPSRANQTISWRSTFGAAVANYAWAEFVVRNGVASGTCLNRKVSAQGTKTSGQTWILTLTITWS